MAKGRRKTNTNKSRKKQNKIDIDLAVVSMIILSILLVVLIYTNSGYIGKTLSPILGGIMGWMKYILPIGTFFIAIHLACEKKETLTKKLIQYGFFLICIGVIMCIYQMTKGNIDSSQDFSKVIQQSYELGQKNIGGGAIGAIVAIPVVQLLGETGGVILAIGVALIILIFMFGIHPAMLITSLVDKMEEKQQDRKERRLEQMQEDDEDEYEDDVTSKKEEKIIRPIPPKKKIVRQEKRRKSSIDIPLDDDQITINMDDDGDKIKKYDHSQDDLFPLGMSSKRIEPKEELSPNELEANLFKTEEPVKEDKSKEVLVLEHTVTVGEENYEFPPIELLSMGKTNRIKRNEKSNCR